MKTEFTDLEDILNFLETTSLEPHDDYTSEFSYKDQKLLWTYIKELNKKYVNAVSDYETTMAEKEQLNSLVNSCQEEIRQLKKQLEEHKNIYIKKVNNFLAEDVEPDPEDLYMAELEQRAMDCELMEMQQKKFIKYLKNKINKIKEQIKNYDIWHEVGTDINFLILKKQFYIEILQKYKEIGDDK